jgi:hypothetical protein
MTLQTKLKERWPIVTVTVVALLLAVGVGPTVASHLKVRSGDIVNNQVKTQDLHRAAVSSGKIRNHGVSRTDLGGGVVAARGYALITGGGDVDASLSRNISDADVSHPGDGLYCIDGLPFAPRHVSLTSARGQYFAMGASLNGDFTGCHGKQVGIVVGYPSTGEMANADFMVTLY